MCKSMTESTESVCASAPGKVILFGEHAVVFGEPAIAAALSDLRITVKVAPSVSRMRIRMPDLPVPLDVVFHEWKGLCLSPSLSEPPTKEDAETIREALLSQVPTMNELHTSAIIPLIYLMNRLTPSQLESGLDVWVRSQDLPVGAGLGSSAAFGVACSAALLRLSLLPRAPPLGKPSLKYLETINTYSFYSEMLLHGTPSGIDNAVSTFGGAIDYTKKDGTTKMEKFQMPPLDLMLANTHVPRSTKLLVAGVRSFYEQHPQVVGSILSCMGHIANDFRQLTCDHDSDDRDSKLLTLVRTNQCMLQSVGVSHPSLERVCEVVYRVSKGAAAAKLTGAGGGGCAMIVLGDKNKAAAIQNALEKGSHPWQYSCLQSSVGQEGVLWVDPTSVKEKSLDKPEAGHQMKFTLVASVLISAFAFVALSALRKR